MIGDYRHLVTFQDPGPALPDGVGGYTETWADLAPSTWYVSLNQPAAGDLERISGGGSVITAGSYLVRGRYHPDVSTKTRMLFSGRTFSITGTRNVDERAVTMELAVVEQIPSPVIGAPPALSYAAQVVADGASHYWRLGEPSGTITVDSVGTAHATISGGVTLNQPGAISDGNAAMTFNGTTGRVTTAAVLVPLVVTVEAWAKIATLSGYQFLFSNRGSPADLLVGAQSGIVICYSDGATVPQVSTPVTLVVGAWNHIVVVHTGPDCTIYVNGALAVTAPQGRSGTPTLSAVGIGSQPAGGDYWNGTLDEIAIYPHALTPAQIAAHYAAATATTRRRR